MFDKVSRIRVAKLLIQETGTYNQQFLRPYVTDTTIGGQELNRLAAKMVGNSTNPILNPLSVVGSGSGFITRQATPEASIGIKNGWDQRRIRFIIEVVVDMLSGGSNSHYYTGYTDFPGVSASTGSIAPDMVFYINSITKTRAIIHHTPMGEVMNQNVVASQHVLFDNDYAGFSNPNLKRTMRPEDIYTSLGNSLLFADADFQKSGFDSRNTLRNTALTADRSLSTPAHYITSVVNNYIHATELEAFGQNEEAVYENARAVAMAEPSSSPSHEDPFMNALSSLRGGVPTNGYFTYQELQRLDPNVINVTNYAIVAQTQVNQLHHAGQTNHWGGSDRMTSAAALLSNAVPALMMELMITRLTFKSTNHDIGGRPRTDILYGRGFSNMDMTMHYERFKLLFEKLIVSDLTYGNSMGYFIEMNVDLMGETWIKISLDGQPPIDYVTPSFCDALFSPIITTSQETILNLSQDFSSLIGSVQDQVTLNSKPTELSFA